ncbi:uncharacterized protein LOC143298005 [Babylonia areolata]|uniref:uncharacterized protein LOC143298005 n=1 Tax=Babylonia areolata TaxID=304850 RepID=UPI003FD53396
MAFPEDPRKRVAEEKKVRIDHSDVYLENEKLSEALNSDLDLLARRCHRQVINRDNEIRSLRKTLMNMNVTKTTSSSSFHPMTTTTTTTTNTNTTTTTTTTTFYRRLKPPPAFVKLDVHVPQQNPNHVSNNDNNNDDDDDVDDSSDEEIRKRWRKITPVKRVGVAWGDPSSREKEVGIGNKGPSSASSGSTKMDVKRVTRQQLVLNNLDMSAIPSSWFTKVHQPSDVNPRRRRAASAHPSNHPSLANSSSASSSPSTSIPSRRPQSEKPSRPRPRRTKSAIPPATSLMSVSSSGLDEDVHKDDSGAMFCGGPQQQKKTESTRSRRQLMEEMGVGGKSGAESGGGDALNSNRVKFLLALRRERERLDGRVKRFLQSCDGVGEAGVSSRRAREFQSFLVPQTLT